MGVRIVNVSDSVSVLAVFTDEVTYVLLDMAERVVKVGQPEKEIVDRHSQL